MIYLTKCGQSNGAGRISRVLCGCDYPLPLWSFLLAPTLPSESSSLPETFNGTGHPSLLFGLAPRRDCCVSPRHKSWQARLCSSPAKNIGGSAMVYGGNPPPLLRFAKQSGGGMGITHYVALRSSDFPPPLLRFAKQSGGGNHLLPTPIVKDIN